MLATQRDGALLAHAHDRRQMSTADKPACVVCDSSAAILRRVRLRISGGAAVALIKPGRRNMDHPARRVCKPTVSIGN